MTKLFRYLFVAIQIVGIQHSYGAGPFVNPDVAESFVASVVSSSDKAQARFLVDIFKSEERVIQLHSPTLLGKYLRVLETHSYQAEVFVGFDSITDYLSTRGENSERFRELFSRGEFSPEIKIAQRLVGLSQKTFPNSAFVIIVNERDVPQRVVASMDGALTPVEALRQLYAQMAQANDIESNIRILYVNDFAGYESSYFQSTIMCRQILKL